MFARMLCADLNGAHATFDADDNFVDQSTAFVLKAGADHWQRVPDMRTARHNCAALLLPNGTVAVLGGATCTKRGQ
eukprot:SAG22_NODE_7704_length_716_cov_0.834684_2_plen_76_part_00